jgi:hypothetical protein
MILPNFLLHLMKAVLPIMAKLLVHIMTFGQFSLHSPFQFSRQCRSILDVTGYAIVNELSSFFICRDILHDIALPDEKVGQGDQTMEHSRRRGLISGRSSFSPIRSQLPQLCTVLLRDKPAQPDRKFMRRSCSQARSLVKEWETESLRYFCIYLYLP